VWRARFDEAFVLSINTSRGPLIDETALTRRSKTENRGFAVDVFEQEPLAAITPFAVSRMSWHSSHRFGSKSLYETFLSRLRREHRQLDREESSRNEHDIGLVLATFASTSLRPGDQFWANFDHHRGAHEVMLVDAAVDEDQR